MRTGGTVVALLGILVMGYAAWIYDPSIPNAAADIPGLPGVPSYRPAGRTINIGLLQNQLMLFLAGLGAAVAGAVAACLGALQEQSADLLRNIATNMHATASLMNRIAPTATPDPVEPLRRAPPTVSHVVRRDAWGEPEQPR